MLLPPVIKSLRARPGMYLAVETIDCVIAFLDGYDAACEHGFLVGFREWLVVRADGGNNLAWSGLVRHILDDDPELNATQQVAGLFELLDAFMAVRCERDGLRRIYAAYEAWLRMQSWYTPDSPSWLAPDSGKK